MAGCTRPAGAHPRCSGGFTLVELTIVIVVLGILVTLAVPRFLDLREDAVRSKTKDLVWRLGQSLSTCHLAYSMNDVAGLPPDADGNGAPDHLGDTSPGEPTLFDALLGQPIHSSPNGWKTYPFVPFPFGGRYYAYLDDLDGNGFHDPLTESYIVYDSATGGLSAYLP